MAIYRTIQLSFWTDEKVLDDFTPEDKYFYLYLFTNPQTNLCGCYQLGWSQTTNQTGYTKESLMRLIERFKETHKVILYSNDTKEIMLLNWHKYNWTTSARFLIPLRKEILGVKDDSFKEHLMKLFNSYLDKALNNKEVKEKELELLKKIEFFDEIEKENIPYRYPIDTTVTVTVTDTVSNTVSDSIKEIIDYLNIVTNSNYTYKNKSTNSLINARLNEGHTVEDFKTVIDKKWNQWKDNEKMVQYCRPNTLFAPSKFESYLNEKIVERKAEKPQSIFDIIANS